MVKVAVVTKNMFYPIRRCIRRAPFLYRAIRALHKKERNYPSAETVLTIEGYPRSGNTYAFYIARELLGASDIIASHYHNIAALKSSKDLHIPTVVLVRDPAAAVVSLAQMDQVESDATSIRRRLKEWIDFYEFVKSSASELHIYSFESLTQNSLYFASYLRELLGLEISDADLESCVKEAELKLRSNESTKPTSGSSLPAQERAISKAKILNLVRGLPEFGEAMSLKADLD